MRILNLKKEIWKIIPFAAIALTIASCYPNLGTVYNSSLDTVLTLFDDTVDFTKFKTYSMPDTLINICDDMNSADCLDTDDKYDDDILQLIATNMQNLGYVREPNPETNGADLFLFVSKVATKNIQVYSYPWWGYWGYYPGWGYYPPYGGGYNPYYPWGGTQVYTYTTGSVLVEMIDTESIGENEDSANSVWSGGMNGVLGGSDVSTRLTNNINQMFIQSPYLKTN